MIPCHNEESSIAELVGEVRQYLPLVVVVDDNCSDQTAARARGAGAQTIRREEPPGKGAAIKAGVATAFARQCAWVLTLDGDGQHRPADIPALLRCAEETGAALVVGNRMRRAEAIPWLRRQVNHWMSRRISALAGRLLPDSQCGFRLINLKAWAGLCLKSDHFEIESEMLLAFVEAGHRVEFIPIQVVANSGRSHIRPVKDTWRWLRWWKSAWCRRGHMSRAGTSAGVHSATPSVRGQTV